MKKILILGSNGFIGRQLVDLLVNTKKYEVLCHSRSKHIENDFTFSYSSLEFYNLLTHVEIVINCTGIGLSKLYRTNETNLQLTQDICDSIVKSKTNAKVLHFSSIKAYNPNKYQDIYSHDKIGAELVFKEKGLLSHTCILRIPIITGLKDLNLAPFLRLAKKIRFPMVKEEIPHLNILSATAFLTKLLELIDGCNKYVGKVVYIINKNNVSWNEIIQGNNKPILLYL